jgi:two-component system cell cycle response regulator
VKATPIPVSLQTLLPGQRRPVTKPQDSVEARPNGPELAVTRSSSAGGDVVPLSYRVTTLSIVRVLIGAALLASAAANGRLDRPSDVLWPLGYLLTAGLLSAGVLLINHRATAVGVLGLVLCLDGAALQWVHHQVGEVVPVELAIGTFLAAACLLASFRTGLKLVIWQSILIGIEDQGIRSGLFHPPPGHRQAEVVSELILLWVLVLVVSVAASVSERELRRRRYDAESVQVFASALHQDDEPLLVLRRTIRFVVEELDAGRVLVCARHSGRLTLLAGHGLDGVVPDRAQLEASATARSNLLSVVDQPGEPALLLILDPYRDRWLAALLPGARRLVVLPLGPDASSEPTWLVFEHRGPSGIRVERRVLATVGQVSAVAALALSRAVLFQQTRSRATTDALTQLPNRRTFDERFASLAGRRPALGFAILFVDVDLFKAVNDTHGHQVGDRLLQAVAAELAAAAPPGALVARYGGEEFVVLLPGTETALAMQVAEELRVAVAAIRDPVPITASFGVAVSSGGVGSEAALPAADAALYRAKQAGRNMVRLATAVDLAGTGP